MMLRVVRCSFLLVLICLRSLRAATNLKVTQITRARGKHISIECTTHKSSQNGVYMYKQERAREPQEIFYFYQETPQSITLTYKQMNNKVIVSGVLPNLNVTILNVTVTDTGFYWCEFNLDEKITLGNITWLLIEENQGGNAVNKSKEIGKECTEDAIPHVKIILILCTAMSLVCFLFFFCVIVKMKGCWRKKMTFTQSNPPSDSVYEEMKRSNLDPQSNVRTFINPDYQSTVPRICDTVR
ncbi:uncharacterized protein LOC100002239 precursor [Danio rerio]|uniref:Si:rp71-81e14.2 n=1 Tax=Danio rerio TaxID=7955 RepID=A4JYQ8_DANRE|nr:uncharacterized protein LOC100002239 precursor [Danio rerio]CAM73240.1 si:rp71-81e14.2 [Danio rerio]|eukprot:NP_001091729.1 uncharacterized protein LOC100002239 precursor [Danio rerio]